MLWLMLTDDLVKTQRELTYVMVDQLFLLEDEPSLEEVKKTLHFTKMTVILYEGYTKPDLAKWRRLAYDSKVYCMNMRAPF